MVGDVIGRYHPHGDAAVYETLVRLAQDFAVRWPLVEGQGNFGNIDGDGAAAMRYTEARLTAIAEALMDGLDEDAVDFRATYDGEDEEPVGCRPLFRTCWRTAPRGSPSAWRPASRRTTCRRFAPPLCHLIDHPEATIEDLVALLPGPDFPTGGVLAEDWGGACRTGPTIAPVAARCGCAPAGAWRRERAARPLLVVG